MSASTFTQLINYHRIIEYRNRERKKEKKKKSCLSLASRPLISRRQVSPLPTLIPSTTRCSRIHKTHKPKKPLNKEKQFLFVVSISVSVIFPFLVFHSSFWVSEFRFFSLGDGFFLFVFGLFGSGFRLENGIHSAKDSNSLLCWL